MYFSSALCIGCIFQPCLHPLRPLLPIPFCEFPQHHIFPYSFRSINNPNKTETATETTETKSKAFTMFISYALTHDLLHNFYLPLDGAIAVAFLLAVHFLALDITRKNTLYTWRAGKNLWPWCDALAMLATLICHRTCFTIIISALRIFVRFAYSEQVCAFKGNGEKDKRKKKRVCLLRYLRIN